MVSKLHLNELVKSFEFWDNYVDIYLEYIWDTLVIVFGSHIN